MKKSPKPQSAQLPSPKQKIEANTLTISVHPDEDRVLTETKVIIGPVATNAYALQSFAKKSIGERSLDSIVVAMAESNRLVNANDLRDVEATLTSQAILLNTMFGDLVRRTGNRFNGETFQLEVVESYFKMAMKAQNQCRMTLETLGNIKNPPAVFARQANINNGGQQQVNNGVAPRAPAREIETPQSKLIEQPNEAPMDTGTTCSTGQPDTSLEAVAALDRAKVT